MITDWLRSHVSKDAQIATQAATIRELTDKLAVAEGRYNAQSVHLRQVEGQRDTAFKCRDDLAEKVGKLSAQLAPFIARNRGKGGRWEKRQPETVDAFIHDWDTASRGGKVLAA